MVDIITRDDNKFEIVLRAVARIGRSGAKTHSLSVYLIVDKAAKEAWFTYTHPYCGSSRWNRGGGYSASNGVTMQGLQTITCSKCGEKTLDLTEINADANQYLEPLGTNLETIINHYASFRTGHKKYQLPVA